MNSSAPRMWRRTYLALAVIRLYFALSQSYLHPDEHFQGPEVVAGHVFSYPIHKSWEFTSKYPIRSVFPLWTVYGTPMLILRSLAEGFGHGVAQPAIVFAALRVLMFALSFVLEDWAVYELVENPEQRRLAIMLVASSYVTWTWQVHTFSNAIETLVVIWSLVLMKRVARIKAHRSGALASTILAFLLVFGTFNRITFPAFVIFPALQLLPDIYKRPTVWITLLAVGGLTALLAIIMDTAFYSASEASFLDLVRKPVLTPLNNLLYNSQSSNLALHGTHPFYQHAFVNLPVLLGPAFPLLLLFFRKGTSLFSAITATILLSFFPHQEARFLLPAVPLLLSSIRLPRWYMRQWVAAWIIFNVTLGILMGIFHQGGIVRAQIYLAGRADVTQAFWWRTYSPPTWLLNGRSGKLETIDLIGTDPSMIENRLCNDNAGTQSSAHKVLVAPRSSLVLERFIRVDSKQKQTALRLEEVWKTTTHMNFDDLDFDEDGIWPTLQRVVGRRGLAIWRIECLEYAYQHDRDPSETADQDLHRDAMT